ncbi:hypothetical protein AVEN_161992-1, partial [Araneus ventricosus]
LNLSRLARRMLSEPAGPQDKELSHLIWDAVSPLQLTDGFLMPPAQGLNFPFLPHPPPEFLSSARKASKTSFAQPCLKRMALPMDEGCCLF